MPFYVCGPNLVFLSCKSTALRRFTWNNFDKNDRTWPQFDLYNFWPLVTSGTFFSIRRIDAWRGTENFKVLFTAEFELLTKNHQGRTLNLPPPPSGRGLRVKYLSISRRMYVAAPHRVTRFTRLPLGFTYFLNYDHWIMKCLTRALLGGGRLNAPPPPQVFRV